MNGKTIEIDNTDAEGRLILAGMLQINTTLTSVPQQHLQCGYTFWLFASDALYYASKEFKPHTIIDFATLTGYVLLQSSLIWTLTNRGRAMMIALGNVYSGVFSVHFFKNITDKMYELMYISVDVRQLVGRTTYFRYSWAWSFLAYATRWWVFASNHGLECGSLQ